MTQRSSTEIAAELADLRAARAELAKGHRPEDVWRDGNRVRYASISLRDLNTLIADLQCEHEAAVNAESGRRRRSAIMLGYRN